MRPLQRRRGALTTVYDSDGKLPLSLAHANGHTDLEV